MMALMMFINCISYGGRLFKGYRNIKFVAAQCIQNSMDTWTGDVWRKVQLIQLNHCRYHLVITTVPRETLSMLVAYRSLKNQ